ncbi:MAG: hypothetical protein ACLTDX_06180 [[Clostridium] innocuum]
MAEIHRSGCRWRTISGRITSHAKAKDTKAGDSSNIIRTDGMRDGNTVAPQISIDHHGGDWSLRHVEAT